MCGILGCLHNKEFSFSLNNFELSLKEFSYRGPDGSGTKEFVVDNYILKSGHVRLSIQDLTELASQPMVSESKRFCLSFNGEIYNHHEIRKELESKFHPNWKGTGDTETLLFLLEAKGVKSTLKKIEGMFSFSLFDLQKKKIYLARDHSGEKPLYISTSPKSLSFASDLNPLKKFPFFKKEINELALQKYLEFNYIPNPESIFVGSFKLPPGCFIEIDLNKFKTQFHSSFNSFISAPGVKLVKWWDLDKVREKNLDRKLNKKTTDKERILSLERVLTESVQKQLISDVPVGAFLSGGIDSSLISALIQRSSGDLKTFTIGFDFLDYDESIQAGEVAKYLGTTHRTFILEKKDFFDLIPSLSEAYSEPFADSSQIPTMLVAKKAKQEVKVALTGDGGDELFGGYNRYLIANNYWKKIEFFPELLRSSLIKVMPMIPKKFINKALQLSPLINSLSGDSSNISEKILTKISGIKDRESFYRSLTREWTKETGIISSFEDEGLNEFVSLEIDMEEEMMFKDFLSYLTDDILCKVDRASMYTSLETRVPILGKSVIEEAYSLPLDLKIRKGKTKWILREILSKYLPREVYEKPKQGFAIPVSKWMRKDLREWVNDTLSDEILNRHNLFDKEVIQIYKNQHFSGSHNHEHKLWSILQFNQWYEKNF